MSETAVRYLGPASGLAEEQSSRLAADLADEMPHHGVRDYFAVKQHMFTEPEYLAAAYEGERCVAIAAASDRSADGEPFTYIETLLIAERLHRTALAPRLLAALFGGVVARLGGFPDLVAMKTYHPRTLVLMRRFADGRDVHFYPDVSRPARGEPARLASGLAKALSPDCAFDPRDGVVRGGAGEVPGDFWPRAPRSGEPDVDHYFATRMTAADRLLCFLDARGERAKQSVLRRLGLPPGASLAAADIPPPPRET